MEDKVDKTKLVLSLKEDITELQKDVEAHKQQLEKFQKKINQVGGSVDGLKEDFHQEITKLRDELNDESQILMKVVSWYEVFLWFSCLWLLCCCVLGCVECCLMVGRRSLFIYEKDNN